MRRKLEYAAAWPFIKILGLLPRPLSRACAIVLARLFYLLHFRLRAVGMRCFTLPHVLVAGSYSSTTSVLLLYGIILGIVSAIVSAPTICPDGES